MGTFHTFIKTMAMAADKKYKWLESGIFNEMKQSC